MPPTPTTTAATVSGPSKNIVELAQGSSDLSTLVTALKAGDLVAALQGKGPFTVFAPSNAAFAKLPKATLESLLEPKNKDKLVGILTYHVVSGAAVYSKNLKATQNVKTLQGQPLLVEYPSHGQILADIQKAIITGVPYWNSGNPEKCTDIYRAVVTKYAPFDGRLQQALQDAKDKPTNHEHGSQGWIFRHAMDNVHRSPRSGVLINRNSKVIAADIAATNGVVHIIDTVLMPPTPTTTTTTAVSGPSKNIVELAQGSSDLSTLVTALKAGDLVAALQGKGPFTVFAPSNAAFAKLPKATLESLLEPKNKDKLVGILKYHVVSGAAVFSKDLKPTQNVKTLQGADVLVRSSSAGVTINRNSKVIAADIAATNGVVHIIDTVLMPPTPTTTITTAVSGPSKNIVELAQGS